MTLYTDVIRYLTGRVGFSCDANGNITEWPFDDAPPTQEDIAEHVSVWESYVASVTMPGRVSAVKAEAGRRILDRYPQYKQNNAALGMYTPEYVADMAAFISAVRAASDEIEARLATDPHLDPATQPEWP